jgi:hypothetical protein
MPQDEQKKPIAPEQSFCPSVELFARRGSKKLLLHVAEGLLVAPLKVALGRLIFEMGNSRLEIFEHRKGIYRLKTQYHVG